MTFAIPRSDSTRELEGWRRNVRGGISTNTTIISGIIARNVTHRTITSSYIVLVTDKMIWVDATAGDITVTLPSAVDNSGYEWIIEKIDSSVNKVIIATADTINGDTSFNLLAQYESARPQSDGTVYWI